jgi:hypothetical protein
MEGQTLALASARIYFPPTPGYYTCKQAFLLRAHDDLQVLTTSTFHLSVFDLRHHGQHKEPIVSLLRKQQSSKLRGASSQMLSQCLTSSPPLLQPEYEWSFCQLAKSSAPGSSALWKDYNLKMSCDWGISVQMDDRTEVRICPESLGQVLP